MAVTKEEVYEFYKDGNWHAKSEAATYFGVSETTIKSRLRDLARDNVLLVCGNRGLKLIRPEDVTTADDAIIVEGMARWMLGVVTRQAMSAKPIKKLMSEARKLLPKSTNERQIVRKYLVQLTHLIDFQEIEE
jgi:hypothetical protein